MPLKTVDEALARLRETSATDEDARLRARVRARLDQTARAPATLLSGGRAGAGLALRVAPAALALVMGGMIALARQPVGDSNELDIFSVRSPYSLAELTRAPGEET